MTPDFINGFFEFCGAAFIACSIRRVLIDRRVAGVSWLTVSFFAVWGLWNLFYYPHLGQWFSFVGGVALVVANAAYVALLLRFSYWPVGK